MQGEIGYEVVGLVLGIALGVLLFFVTRQVWYIGLCVTLGLIYGASLADQQTPHTRHRH